MEKKKWKKIEKKSLDLSATYYLQCSWLGAIGVQKEVVKQLNRDSRD